MIAKDRGHVVIGNLVALAAIGGVGLMSGVALAQQGRQTGRAAVGAPARPAADPGAGEQPVIRTARHLVNPNDPAAVVNKEPITRQQLADECLARKGVEILETMIARKLVDQEIKRRHLDVTQAEVDAEITRVAQTIARTTREQWLATLAKDRGISPAQYARDIIYPSLALRKLAAPRVKVTAQDIQEAYEAEHGDRLKCRIIMCEREDKAKRAWEEVKKNPKSWETVVSQYSFDQATRAVGGMLSEPITRHAEPRNVTDAAFRDLVDGDPALGVKPQDGDISSVIQVARGDGQGEAWVIIKRESHVPAQQFKGDEKAERKRLEALIFENKVQVEIGEVFNELTRAAEIENKLTGAVKLANEQDIGVDGDVKLMSDPNRSIPVQKPATASTPGARTKAAAPPAVSAKDQQDAARLKR
jgi:foldase protein PrsA